MNQFIKAQVINMINMTKTFQQACELAARKDDGTISKDEAKTLKQIEKATQEYQRALKKAVSNSLF